MTKHWCYTLSCQDDRTYVGETTSLFRRWNQHVSGNGGKCTKEFPPECIIGLYDISKNIAFLNYVCDNNYQNLMNNFNNHWETFDYTYFNNFDIENYIAELFMINNKDKWWKVRGGKHTDLIDDDKFYHECNNCPDNTCKDCLFHKNESDKRNQYLGIPTFKDIEDCVKPVIKIKSYRPNCKCGYPCEISISKKNDLYFRCALRNTEWINFEQLDLDECCSFYEMYIKK